jgi:hypothetical protein
MKLLRYKNDPKFAIPVNHIAWVNMEESSGGRYWLRIGAGGKTHHLDCDNIKVAKEIYDEIINALEEL